LGPPEASALGGNTPSLYGKVRKPVVKVRGLGGLSPPPLLPFEPPAIV